MSRRGYAFQLLAAAGWTSIPFLPLLRQPTLVLTGDDDPIIPVVNGHLLAALIPPLPAARLPRRPPRTHRGPERLAPVIEEFLDASETGLHIIPTEDTR